VGPFSKGDKVTVTNPIQPTDHKGGETGVVVRTRDDLVQIRQDSDGSLATVFVDEISKS
jgi:hypothetical protein